MRLYLNGLRQRTGLVFLTAWIGIAMISVSWAITSPLGASPDEPAHIIKAASVVRGQFIGKLTDKPAVTKVSVPFGIAQASAWPCYAFHQDVPASCMGAAVKDGGATTQAETSAGLYDPVYYLAVGWPSLLTNDTTVSVLLMRTVSAIISSFFLALTLCALLLFRFPFVGGIGFLAAATPMVYFLNSAVNPNALEISAGCALLALLLLLVRGPHVRHMGRVLTLVCVSGVLLANARGISPLWMALIAVASILAAQRGRLGSLLRRWDVRISIGVLALGVVCAGLWILATGTLSSMGSFPGAGRTTPVGAFVRMLIDRSFDPGIIGVFGWLDTPSPALVYVVWSCLSLGLVVVAIVLARGRLLAGVLTLVGSFLLVPPIVQAASIKSSGYIWQGRYTLVAYACLMIMAAIAVGQSKWASDRVVAPWIGRAVVVVGALVITGQLFAEANVIKRYAVGYDGTWGQFVVAPAWQPPGGAAVWLAATLVGGLLLVLPWAVRSAADRTATPAISRMD